MHMSIDRYKTFVAAATCSTFLEAADMLNISPATVSKQIASLEKELSVILFDRMTHGVRLTRAGEARLPMARRFVDAYTALMNMTGEPKLRIYSTPPPSRFGLSAILKEFSAERPNLPIEIIENRETPSAIESGECELGFIGSKHRLSSSLECVDIRSTRIGALLPESHRMAGKEKISLAELCDEDFILPNPEVHVHQVYIDCCCKCGFTPNIVQTAFRDDSVLFFVSNGQGVSLFTREMLAIYNFTGLVFMPLEEEFYSGGALARSKNTPLSQPAQIFWDFILHRYKLESAT